MNQEIIKKCFTPDFSNVDEGGVTPRGISPTVVKKEEARLHLLKLNPEYFMSALWMEKSFEIRKNDRFFRIGDFIRLDEFDKDMGYTGRIPIFRKISYISTYAQNDHVVLGLEKVSLDDPDFYSFIKDHFILHPMKPGKAQ